MAKPDCIVCGQEHPRCSGHRRAREGEAVRPCMVWPRDTEAVCRLHGGNLPTVRAKGVADRAAKQIEADAYAVLGYTLDGKVPNLLDAMEGLAAMALAQVTALGARVNALTNLRYRSDYSVEQLRAEVSLLERSMDRAGKLLEMVAKHRPDGEAAAARNLLTALAEKLDDLEQ